MLEKEINKILTDWNPLSVPQYISEYEYVSYVPHLKLLGNNEYEIKKYLIKITKKMGITGDDKKTGLIRKMIAAHDIDGVTKKIINLYK